MCFRLSSRAIQRTQTFLQPSFSERSLENECYCVCASAPPLGQKLWIRLWRFTGARGWWSCIVLSLSSAKTVSEAYLMFPQPCEVCIPIVFSRAPLFSGCVRSLHQPFSALPCVYKLFRLARFLSPHLTRELVWCAKHLRRSKAPACPLSLDIPTSFHFIWTPLLLPFFKAPTVFYSSESSGCRTIMKFYSRAGLATSQCVNNTLLSLF